MKKSSKNSKMRLRRHSVKKREKSKKRERGIEREYRLVFTPHPLPFNGLYTDTDSLEQPSALKYVDSTTTPAIDVAIDPQPMR
jgi:hypothetical protein